MANRNISDIDDKTRLKVHGYLRMSELVFTMTIPMMIQFTIMLYYWINEKFTKHGKYIELSMNDRVATTIKAADAFNTVYGNGVINHLDTSIKKYKWKFKLIKLGDED